MQVIFCLLINNKRVFKSCELTLFYALFWILKPTGATDNIHWGTKKIQIAFYI